MSAEILNSQPEVSAVSITKPTTDGVQNSIDGPDLVPLFQCLGFVLQDLQKNDNLEELHKLLKNKEENAIKVEITCVKSGTKATLFKENCSCKCPSEEAHRWNITTLQGNVSVSKSDVIPSISSAKSKTIHTLLSKCMEFIVSTNPNESVEVMDECKQSSTMTSQKSAENLKSDQNVSKITLGSSPPRGSSSPINDLCKSLKNSRSSLEGNEKLTDVLKRIDKLVKHAIELSGGTNVTFTKTSMMKISPLATISNTSQKNVNVTNADVVEPKSTPSTKTPKKEFLSTGVKKRGLVPPSRLNLLKYKREGGSSALSRTPSSSAVKDKTGKSLNLSSAKIKTALSVDGALQSKLKVRTPIFGSKIAMKK